MFKLLLNCHFLSLWSYEMAKNCWLAVLDPGNPKNTCRSAKRTDSYDNSIQFA